MRFTPALAASFGDWLECDAIRRALLAELPDLAPRWSSTRSARCCASPAPRAR